MNNRNFLLGLFYLITFIFLPAPVQALSESSTPVRQWLTPDFYVETLSPEQEKLEHKKRAESSSNEESQDCRAHISKVICLVDPIADPDVDQPPPRQCLEGGKDYAHFFEELYDHYPPALQKMFCSLKVLNIEKQFAGTAYAGVLKDPQGNVIGARMGIRKSVLDQNLSLEQWASWKEQLSFGGITGSYRLKDDLPIVETQSKPGISDFLYFVVTHEFGHIFDFANGLNRTLDDGHTMHPESWGALSWITDEKPKPENDFPHRKELCFYWCNGKPLARQFIPELYANLDRSNLISIYATTQPWDDFADSLAYYLMDQNLATTYRIYARYQKSGSLKVYEIMEKLHSERFASKYRYMDQFLKRTDILYP